MAKMAPDGEEVLVFGSENTGERDEGEGGGEGEFRVVGGLMSSTLFSWIGLQDVCMQGGDVNP